MTSDLFPDCKMDSPRLAWMKRHGVFAYHDERGYYVSLYDANPSSRTSFFETEDEALASWASGCGIPLWNEEQYINNKDKHQ